MRMSTKEVEERIHGLLSERTGDSRLSGPLALNLELLLALSEEVIISDLVAQAGARLDLWSGGHLSDCEGECTCGYREILNTWEVAYHQYNQHRYGRQ